MHTYSNVSVSCIFEDFCGHSQVQLFKLSGMTMLTCGEAKGLSSPKDIV